MIDAFNWTCPHCDRDVTISKITSTPTNLTEENSEGEHVFLSKFIVCPNPKCKKFTLSATLYTANWVGARRVIGEIVKEWQLIPFSKAKVLPEYIPKVIRDDYVEACAIVSLSPKASATLSRRCLQGILRDFWNVKPANLAKEIESIKDLTDPLTWDAIDSVRKVGNIGAHKVGNIGAHMEKDINVIVEVDENEAELLIKLLEILFRDWYINQYERKLRLEKIVQISSSKQTNFP